jgi:hypothetical protein
MTKPERFAIGMIISGILMMAAGITLLIATIEKF